MEKKNLYEQPVGFIWIEFMICRGQHLLKIKSQ